MGYFSDLAQKYIDFDYDRSYPSPEKQLLWRLDDLNYKLEELTKKDAPYRGWERLTDNDIRYSIPGYFGNIADVERAIELAIEDLKNKYEIYVLEECDNKAMELDEVADAKKYTDLQELTPEQLRTFLSKTAIHERAQKWEKTSEQQTDIYFRYIGSIPETPIEKAG